MLAPTLPRIQILERTLSRVRHRDFSPVKPGRNEHAITPAGRCRLHLEVAVEVMKRTEDGGWNGLLLFLEAGRDRGHAPVELAPLRLRFARWEQRHHRADFLFLLGAGECVTAAVEDAVQRVVVAHRDRVELVIVTPRTAETQAEHRLPQIVDRVLNRQVVIVLRVEAEPPRDREIAGRDRAFGVAFTITSNR